VKRLLVLALCLMVTAGCSDSNESATPATTSQSTGTTTETTPSPGTSTRAPRTYRELMARLPPFDEPASPEVAAWRKATIGAFLGRCVASRGGADKASFVRANRRILNEAAVFPGATLINEYSIDERDGNGCPAGSGPATYYTTYRTYRLPAGTKPARVIAHYERGLRSWFEAANRPCERSFGQGPAYVAVSACNGVLRLSVRARGPVEVPTPEALPPRPFGAQYPLAPNYLATPRPTANESEPGETCERISGVDVPSIIVPPPPGVSAQLRGKQIVVRWSLGTVHGDCPPAQLILSSPPVQASAIREPVHAASGVTRMRLPDGMPTPKRITARTVSVDGTQSRAVAVLVRRAG
jgi:hypothetical protein